jgi:cation diffusion facilitator family transporter
MEVANPKQQASPEAQGRRVTWLGLYISLGLIGLKAAAGYWGNSRALLADAAHSASDLISDIVVLLGFKWGRAPADEQHPWGHGRVETLTSALVGLSLLLAALAIVWDAVQQLVGGAAGRPGWLAIGAAGLSVLVKEALYRYTQKVARKLNSPLLEANAWHHRSDALSSLAVLAGVAGAAISPALWLLDPLAALIVGLLVFKIGVRVIHRAGRELVDTSPEPQTLDRIREMAREVPGVLEVHDLMVRSTAGWLLIELHVVVEGEQSVRQGHAIAKEVEHRLDSDAGRVARVTVHVDPGG